MLSMLIRREHIAFLKNKEKINLNLLKQTALPLLYLFYTLILAM